VFAVAETTVFQRHLKDSFPESELKEIGLKGKVYTSSGVFQSIRK
jgi:hypothetical protein